MGKGKKLTESECGKILAYRDQKLPIRAISEKIGRSPKAVHSFLNNPNDYSRKNPGGRPKSISPAMGRRILRSVKAKKGMSSSKIKTETNCNASPRTIRRFFEQKWNEKDEKKTETETFSTPQSCKA